MPITGPSDTGFVETPGVIASVKLVALKSFIVAAAELFSIIAVFKSVINPLLDVSQNISNSDKTGSVSKTAKFCKLVIGTDL